MTILQKNDHDRKQASIDVRCASMEKYSSTGGSIPRPASAREVKPLDQMRAYRACLNCRSRKSRCDLDINGGRTPCRRCTRENRECILGESHRGGRRVRKQKPVERPKTAATNGVSFSSPTHGGSSFSPGLEISHLDKTSEAYHHALPRNTQEFSWQQARPPGTVPNGDVTANPFEQLLDATSDQQSFRSRDGSGGSSMSIPPGRVHEGIASADLQNPSDALDILAQVADRAEDGHGMLRNRARPNDDKITHSGRQTPNTADQLAYKPFTDGILRLETIHQLIDTFEANYHPYFPIISLETFDRRSIHYLSHKEPHLFSAILTIASKENESVHRICYDHTQSLVSMLLTGADAGVEAVEALLLLSQWVSHRPQASVAVGRGEEDRVAWMYIGTALRLAYYIGLDRTSFKSDSNDGSKRYERERLAWCACYYCDRSISIRVGKGFWSRGPTEAQYNFRAMRSRLQNGDDWAAIFEAHFGLTQIFGNAHDILYSTKGFYAWSCMLEGRYARHIDDFASSIRRWNETWRNFKCSAKLRAALFMTYDYLRLYVNAFAYQATMFRALTKQRDSVSSTSSHESQPLPIPQLNASSPDARFIYEAIDAAKSLLSRYINFSDPGSLPYMPLSNDLYIIYSAVFLYKARITTNMAEDERAEIRSIVKMTIDRLSSHSFSSQHMGSRYARLLNLLWRRTPRSAAGDNAHPSHISQHHSHPNDNNNNNEYHTNSTKHLQVPPKHQPQGVQGVQGGQGVQSPTLYQAPTNGSNNAHLCPVTGASASGWVAPSTFSWLDLGATWNFATQNNGGESIGGSGSSNGEVDEGFLLSGGGGGGGGGGGRGGRLNNNGNNGNNGNNSGGSGGGSTGDAIDVHMSLPLMTADYSLLENDNPNFIF